jgi:hypothetical protein
VSFDFNESFPGTNGFTTEIGAVPVEANVNLVPVTYLHPPKIFDSEEASVQSFYFISRRHFAMPILKFTNLIPLS